MIKLTKTDGGKAAEGFDHEYNDCGVRALAVAANLPYAKAHALLKAEGRRDRKGTKVTWFIPALRKAGIVFQELNLRDPKPHWIGGRSYTVPTLAEVIRRYPKGRYILASSRHGLALIDGVIHDAGEISGARTRIKFAYKIELEAPAKPAPITQAQVVELWERLNKLEAR